MSSRLNSRWSWLPVPRASRWAHLRAAAFLWTGVGGTLAAVGVHWMLHAGLSWAAPAFAAAVVLGWLKARYILNRTADRIARRIELRGDGRCLGGFLSWRSWLLVLLMMVLGRWLRVSPLPIVYRGLIYAAIGVGLFLGGVRLWRVRMAPTS